MTAAAAATLTFLGLSAEAHAALPNLGSALALDLVDITEGELTPAVGVGLAQLTVVLNDGHAGRAADGAGLSVHAGLGIGGLGDGQLDDAGRGIGVEEEDQVVFAKDLDQVDVLADERGVAVCLAALLNGGL